MSQIPTLAAAEATPTTLADYSTMRTAVGRRFSRRTLSTPAMACCTAPVVHRLGNNSTDLDFKGKTI